MRMQLAPKHSRAAARKHAHTDPRRNSSSLFTLLSSPSSLLPSLLSILSSPSSLLSSLFSLLPSLFSLLSSPFSLLPSLFSLLSSLSSSIKKSLPPTIASQIVDDDAGNLDATRKMLQAVWNWRVSVEEAEVVYHVFCLLYNRSAALLAVAISGLCVATGSWLHRRRRRRRKRRKTTFAASRRPGIDFAVCRCANWNGETSSMEG
eukprot:GHVU01140903.1.p1 GENE.GHVU01140903.1~~GHVU01140903.1.p1  ORF type:complete len:205 (+),score=31.35 GHVU01140903.1:508-1122(+)